MEIKLPIVLEATDYHEFKIYKDLFNKVIKLSDNESDLKDAVNFVEIGCNRQYYAFYYDSSSQLDNNQIITTLLETYHSKFKSSKEIQDFLDDFVNTDILKNINLNLIINNLEQKTISLNTTKNKKSI